MRLPVIDGLRGYAILAVIYFHLAGTFLNPPGFVSTTLFGVPVYPLGFLGNGWLGVNLFFILSGFVLYWPYATQKRKCCTVADGLRFYQKRAARLLPLYYFMMLFGLVFIANRSDIYNPEYWRNAALKLTATYVFFKQYFIPAENYVFWSLGVEIWFSLLFPIIAFCISRWGFFRTGIGVYALSFAVRGYAVTRPDLFVTPHLHLLKDGVFGRLDDLVTGMVLARWYAERRFEEVFSQHSFGFLLVALAVLFVGGNLADYLYLGQITRLTEPFLYSILQVGFSLLILTFLYSPSRIIWFLSSNLPLCMCGMMCYSLYVWHGLLRQYFIADLSTLRIATYFFLLFSIAGLSFYFIERTEAANQRGAK